VSGETASPLPGSKGYAIPYFREETMHRYLTLAVLGFQTLFPAGVFALSDGEKAPPFRAQSTQGPVGIEDYRGKRNVVLAYYFRDFTSV
jgi:hypothetical protein